MWIAIAALVVGMVGGVAFLAYLGSRSGKEFARQNELVPGRPSVVPAAWAGQHHPEARLHRRLVEAMAALRANQAFDDDGGLLTLRVELEQQAQAIDERLVGIAALPERVREEPRTQATAQVAQIEDTVAALAGRSAQDAGPALAAALQQLREHSDLVAEVRAELDQPSVPDAGSAAGERAETAGAATVEGAEGEPEDGDLGEPPTQVQPG